MLRAVCQLECSSWIVVSCGEMTNEQEGFVSGMGKLSIRRHMPFNRIDHEKVPFFLLLPTALLELKAKVHSAAKGEKAASPGCGI